MDLRRFSLVRGASVTGGSGGVAGTRGGCEGVTGVNRAGCGRQPERYRSALTNNCTQTQNSDYT